MLEQLELAKKNGALKNYFDTSGGAKKTDGIADMTGGPDHNDINQLEKE